MMYPKRSIVKLVLIDDFASFYFSFSFFFLFLCRILAHFCRFHLHTKVAHTRSVERQKIDLAIHVSLRERSFNMRAHDIRQTRA